MKAAIIRKLLMVFLIAKLTISIAGKVQNLNPLINTPGSSPGKLVAYRSPDL